MDNLFFDQPIINSPYYYPTRHWELDAEEHPTQRNIETCRGAEFITPIPKPRQRGRARRSRGEFVRDKEAGLSTQDQRDDVTAAVNEIWRQVDRWRIIPSPSDWDVTPETARLLLHCRQHELSHYRPFFCQVEARAVQFSNAAMSIMRVTGRTTGRSATVRAILKVVTTLAKS